MENTSCFLESPTLTLPHFLAVSLLASALLEWEEMTLSAPCWERLGWSGLSGLVWWHCSAPEPQMLPLVIQSCLKEATLVWWPTLNPTMYIRRVIWLLPNLTISIYYNYSVMPKIHRRHYLKNNHLATFISLKTQPVSGPFLYKTISLNLCTHKQRRKVCTTNVHNVKICITIQPDVATLFFKCTYLCIGTFRLLA